MTRRIKAVIFDLDGTLVNAYKAVTDSINYAFEHMGYPQLTLDEVIKNVGWGERELMTRFVKDDHVDKTLSIFRQHHRFALKTGVKFLPGAKELIKWLRGQEFQLAIATNRPTRFTHIILKQLNHLEMFDYVLCADKVERAKPAPDMLEQILAKFAIKADEALYVGDMAIDVEAGNNAQIRTVAVTTGSSSRAEIQAQDPFDIVSKILDLTEILEGHSLTSDKKT